MERRRADSRAGHGDQELDGIRFRLIGCKRTGASATCEVMLTSLGEDRVLKLTQNTRLIDSEGEGFNVTRYEVGNSEAAYALNPSLPGDVPVKAVMTFARVGTQAESIALFEIVTIGGKIKFKGVAY